jgi:general secretion pathway protein I
VKGPVRIRARTRAASRGFTLIEVLVALVIVAFGIGAVLAALSGSASNVSSLREKTLAQWVALNRVTDVRMTLQGPTTGTTEGDVKNFGNSDWHWQQIVTAVDEIPGMLQITVKVRRTGNTTVTGSSSGGGKITATTGTSATSGSSSGADNWTTTVVGFRGDALSAASGEVPTWSGTDTTGASSSGSSSSSSSGTGVTTGSTLTPPSSSSSSSSGGS